MLRAIRHAILTAAAQKTSFDTVVHVVPKLHEHIKDKIKQFIIERTYDMRACSEFICHQDKNVFLTLAC